MGATAAIGTLAGRGKATQSDQHRLGEHRLYTHLGPLATIIGGPSRRAQTTTHTALVSTQSVSIHSFTLHKEVLIMATQTKKTKQFIVNSGIMQHLLTMPAEGLLVR
jgi:hypothetical protein